MEIKLPRAIKTDNLKIGDLTLEVSILDDGQRVISSKSLEDFIASLMSDRGISDEQAKEIAMALKS